MMHSARCALLATVVVCVATTEAAVGSSAASTTSTSAAFDGPFSGLPLPDLTNRRCGDGHNGVPDMNSTMCKGSTVDGRLSVSLQEIEQRCSADSLCIGFGELSQGGAGSYFRPVVNYTRLDPTKAGWKLWQKHGYKPAPGPPAPPPGPPPPPPPPPAEPFDWMDPCNLTSVTNKSVGFGWCDYDAAPKVRAAALVAAMTLDEKARTMQPFAPPIARLRLPPLWTTDALHGAFSSHHYQKCA